MEEVVKWEWKREKGDNSTQLYTKQTVGVGNGCHYKAVMGVSVMRETCQSEDRNVHLEHRVLSGSKLSFPIWMFLISLWHKECKKFVFLLFFLFEFPVDVKLFIETCVLTHTCALRSFQLLFCSFLFVLQLQSISPNNRTMLPFFFFFSAFRNILTQNSFPFFFFMFSPFSFLISNLFLLNLFSFFSGFFSNFWSLCCNTRDASCFDKWIIFYLETDPCDVRSLGQFWCDLLHIFNP